MRIISGTLKGRIIPELHDIKGVFPSSDILKGALFNIIGKDIEGKVFCDLYAGSGNIGFEAASRGASFCVFIEYSNLLTALIIKTAKKFNIEGRIKVIKKDAVRAIESGGFLEEYKPGYIFVDPPYNEGLCEKTIKAIAERTPAEAAGKRIPFEKLTLHCKNRNDEPEQNSSLEPKSDFNPESEHGNPEPINSSDLPEIIIQHDEKETLSESYPPYRLIKKKKHGRSFLSFYSASDC